MTKRGSRLVAVAALVLLIVAGYFAYDRLVARPERERAEALALSETLTATFSRAAVLKVGTLTGTARAEGRDSRMFGWLNSQQRLVAPYSVDYTVELKNLGAGDYRWDPARRRLEVRLPDVRVGQPNVDESKLRIVDRKGVFVTVAAMDAMRLQASTGLRAAAAATAAKPEHLAKARENARTAFAALVQGPLAASGQRDIVVMVRFATELRGTYEPWDESRSIADVLRGEPVAERASGTKSAASRQSRE